MLSGVTSGINGFAHETNVGEVLCTEPTDILTQTSGVGSGDEQQEVEIGLDQHIQHLIQSINFYIHIIIYDNDMSRNMWA